MLQSQNNSVIVQNIVLTFCKNRPFNETQNSKLGEMHGGGGGGGLTLVSVFQTRCHVLERIPLGLKFQRWYQDHHSLSLTVPLYHKHLD